MSEAMAPFGKALLDLHRGVIPPAVIVHRDDGLMETLPMELFIRSEEDLSDLERMALELCTSPVLDAGAGAGTHSLILQRRGVRVTALDICPEAVTVMRERGVIDARLGGVREFESESFSTILMLGRSVGMVETLGGLGSLLKHAHRLLSQGGQILCDSLDVRVTSRSHHLAYQEANRRAGRYVGEMRTRFEYDGQLGAWCGWLHVDPDTLATHAQEAGYQFAVVRQGSAGDYLARLIVTASAP